MYKCPKCGSTKEFIMDDGSVVDGNGNCSIQGSNIFVYELKEMMCGNCMHEALIHEFKTTKSGD